MKHSVMALGERHLEGEYKNVRAAGDLEIKTAESNRCFALAISISTTPRSEKYAPPAM